MDAGKIRVSARRSRSAARVDDGADSYLIRNGSIVAQTIHYTVKKDDR